tara:strand:+ start:699 stop:1010 length:312 start_codon:yes stop_codon:yes gene_type:complete
MNAVIISGGKQFYVQEGDIIEVEKTIDEPGAEIQFDKVLLLADSNDVISDPNLLKSAKVKAKVLAKTKGKKIKVFKFRRRQDSKTLNGHRQSLQKIEILSITK